MAATGDWLIPHANGLPRYDKPPLANGPWWLKRSGWRGFNFPGRGGAAHGVHGRMAGLDRLEDRRPLAFDRGAVGVQLDPGPSSSRIRGPNRGQPRATSSVIITVNPTRVAIVTIAELRRWRWDSGTSSLITT